MKTYELYYNQTVTVTKTIEADSLAEAIDKAQETSFPSLMFTDHTYPDTGEWELDEEALEEDYPDEDPSEDYYDDEEE